MSETTLFTTPETSSQRKLIAEKLAGVFTASSLENFMHCGTHGFLIKHNCGHKKARIMRCNLRVCPGCSARLLKRQFAICSDLIRMMRHPRFLTLTVENTENISAAIAQGLKKLFYNFRRKKDINPLITGGIIVTEVTHRGNGYHVHLHIIYDGAFMHWKRVMHAWEQVTGQEKVHIDIRDCRSTGQAISYLSGYLKKGGSFLSLEHFTEYHKETKGTRYFQTFGSLYKQETFEPSHKDLLCECCGESIILFGFERNASKTLVPLVELYIEVGWHGV
jgi:hypothetical protein